MWLVEMLAAGAHISLGQFDEAERLARSSIHRPGAGFWTFAAHASALGQLGRIEEARLALARVRELKPDFSREWFDAVWIGVDPSFTTPYFAGLRKAGLDTRDDATASDEGVPSQ